MPNIDYGPVRARDLRDNMRQLGDIQGIIVTLERLLDEFAAHRQYLRELANQHTNLVDLMRGSLALAEQLQLNITGLKSMMEKGDEHG